MDSNDKHSDPDMDQREVEGLRELQEAVLALIDSITMLSIMAHQPDQWVGFVLENLEDCLAEAGELYTGYKGKVSAGATILWPAGYEYPSIMQCSVASENLNPVSAAVTWARNASMGAKVLAVSLAKQAGQELDLRAPSNEVQAVLMGNSEPLSSVAAGLPEALASTWSAGLGLQISVAGVEALRTDVRNLIRYCSPDATEAERGAFRKYYGSQQPGAQGAGPPEVCKNEAPAVAEEERPDLVLDDTGFVFRGQRLPLSNNMEYYLLYVLAYSENAGTPFRKEEIKAIAQRLSRHHMSNVKTAFNRLGEALERIGIDSKEVMEHVEGSGGGYVWKAGAFEDKRTRPSAP